MDDLFVRITTRMILPFIQIYGLYVIIHGHLSPGGAFSGGSIFAASIVLYTLAYGLKPGQKRLPHHISSKIETGGILFFILIGLIGVALGYTFLTNQEAGFPMGEIGRVLSAGLIPVVTFALGLKVMSTVVTLFHTMMEEE
ncbi:multicomponent Na+:H+ antiporter subunit B [Pelagirhabdus alkalitolerans]|uniref:Multicomponent Na+:H+ antiporter subunit B n=1 Tax=Pelagirhabdus alkalitolerans TaxID=1612202 RepID=A0A1G6H838_9BACI|nr:MnhB domain-containing protein [Pelagirhabdus alkalitolerans]SDB90439.1 multicomponent Na+:H+ antiporter subunit B [Pelagirhabdus alkalitolerans]